MNKKEKDIFFLINPNAGQNKGGKKWKEVEKILKSRNLKYEFAFTQGNGSDKQIVRDKVLEGFRIFAIVGGDGTLNEAVNGFYMQTEVPVSDIYMGIILTGTGNDWAKYYGFNTDVSESIDRIIRGKTKMQDLGCVSYMAENNEVKKAYFINCAGLGIDSEIVRLTNSTKKRGNRTQLVYLLSLLKAVFKYKAWPLKIYINEEVYEDRFLSVNIGNGKYSGGGMMQTPNAVNDDGLLDVTIYNNMSLLKILRKVRKLYNADIYSVKGIDFHRTKYLKIESPRETFMEIDGEIIGNAPYEIEVVSMAINIFI